MRFEIPVENIEALRKKMAKIQKKAERYNCSVSYQEKEEYFEKVRDENGFENIRKFITVEAEGIAKINDWVFAGTIEHTPTGNILRSVSDEYKIPERYIDAEPYCEHCSTKRARKDTYIIFNEVTGEFKQVGKSCLKDYTNGLSANDAAFILQWDKEMKDYCFVSSGNYEYFWGVKEISKYFVETMRKFGWANSSSNYSTKEQAIDFYHMEHPLGSPLPKEFQKELEAKAASVKFNPENISDEYIEAALEWAKSWDNHEYNDYRQNLKVIAQMEYCKWKHLGYLASLFMTYDKEMEREIKRAKSQSERAKSQHMGEVKTRITCAIKDWKVLTAWETEWGIKFMYEFTTEDGNILIWKTGKSIEGKEIANITGTVKAHTEFRGIKQTELTRCKVA